MTIAGIILCYITLSRRRRHFLIFAHLFDNDIQETRPLIIDFALGVCVVEEVEMLIIIHLLLLLAAV